MKKIVCLWTFILAINISHAQYWQQKVDYKIGAVLNDTSHSLSGHEEIYYTNNSPNTLDEIYILLYANAFNSKESDFAKQQATTFKKQFIYFEKKDYGYVDSLNFSSKGKPMTWNFEDKTHEIVKILLNEHLKTGESLKIETSFYLKFPKAVSRLGHNGQSYQVSQWYPKAAVYNQKGWNLLHYLDKGEFFSDFGDYDVTITLPENYVVGATGNLQTQSELNWLEEKAKENISLESITSTELQKAEKVEIPSAPLNKTIHYTQKSVIDFAWFADKKYYVRTGSVKLPNSERTVTTWAMFSPSFLNAFEKSIEYIDSAVYYYSKFVGDYPFDNCTAVSGPMSAGGGMEYPTITIISVKNNVREVITHEVGHNWFQGVLATNERRYAWLDEGINSFYDHRVETILSGNADIPTLNKHKEFKKINLNRVGSTDEMKLMYMQMCAKEYDQPINLTSKEFCAVNYGGIIYGKTAFILAHLARYYGHKKFDKTMQAYFEKWKFKHPYPNDLQQVFIEETGDSLSWLFNDLINTTRKNDYAIKSVSTDKLNSSIVVKIKNKGKINVPLTLGFVNKNNVYNYIWIEGFEGTKSFSLPIKDYQKIAINAEESLYDVNMKNNFQRKFGISPFSLKIGYTLKSANKNQILVLPSLGYNSYDGFMFGAIFYNFVLPKRRFEYIIAPMYGPKSKRLAGFSDLRLNFFPYSENNRYKLQFGLKAKRYADAFNDKVSLGYNKVEPSISFEFKKRPLMNFNNNAIKIRGIYINREQLNFEGGKFITKNTNEIIHELSYLLENLRPLHKQKLSVKIQSIYLLNKQPSATKIFCEYFISLPYKWRNTGLDVRIFAGTFAQKNTKDNWAAKYNYGIGAGSFTDYTLDHTYFGRTETTGFSAAQIFISDAGLKIPYTLTAPKNIIALNLASSLPGRIPLKFYFDIATYNEKIAQSNYAVSFSGGIKFTAFEKGIEIYFPIINSKDIIEFQKNNNLKYYRQITFLIDFQKFDIFDIYKYAINLM